MKALVFDAYGTLFDVHSVATVLNLKFPDHGAALSGEWRIRQLEYTWLRALMGRYEDFWKVTESALAASCEAMKLPLEPNVRKDLMEAYLTLAMFPDVEQALKSLTGMPLAILSNGTPKMLQAVVENAGLGKAFTHILSVDRLKTYKPNPAVYGLAAQTLGIEKDEIGFVSSNFWDCAGGKAFGFKTYWVNRSGAAKEELGAAPDATLKSLADLAPLNAGTYKGT